VTTPPDAGAVEVFEAERSRLTGLAYRMLGTADDADDVVQDTWLRWEAADRSAIAEPAAWLTTVATRIAIDRLRSARHRREVYVGPWLPEPLPAVDDAPFAAAATSESLTLGFLTVLERLEPVERAVFLLHDVFGYPFVDVAASVDRTEAAARQIAKRARERVQGARPRVDADPDHAEELAAAFLAAIVHGDLDALKVMLTEDVLHLSDGGAERRAARRPIVGPERVARFLISIAGRAEPGTQVDQVRVNGEIGWYLTVDGRPDTVLVPSFRDGLVASVLAVRNPDKLARFHAAWLATR